MTYHAPVSVTCPRCRGTGMNVYVLNVAGEPKQHQSDCFTCEGVGKANAEQLRAYVTAAHGPFVSSCERTEAASVSSSRCVG